VDTTEHGAKEQLLAIPKTE